MSNRFPKIRQLSRDGTSQADRRLDALDPATAPLDERTLSDLLLEVYGLAKDLIWHGDDDRADGTWDRLFDPSGIDAAGAGGSGSAPGSEVSTTLGHLAQYSENPRSLPRDLVRRLSPPHIWSSVIVFPSVWMSSR